MRRKLSELAQRLNRLHAPSQKFPALLLMTDAKRLPDPRDLIPHLPPNSAIIIRHFSDYQKVCLIHKIKKLCHKHKVKLLVSDSLSLAINHRLDGVHFSEKTLKKIAACGKMSRPKPNLLFTTACHNLRSLCAAERANMDAILLSPLFKTQSHPNQKTLGPWAASFYAQRTDLKVYGLGGINYKNGQRLSQARISGFAGISGLI